jgi:hypothetical protein
VARKPASKKQDVKQETTESFDPVDFAVTAFNRSWKYTSSNYHPRWERAFKLYNNQRTDRAYEGITNTFVPMTFSTVETLVSALAGNKPSFDFIPPHQKQDQNTQVLNSLLDYYWDKDQWNIKVINWIRSSVLYGTGIVFLVWDIDHPRMVNIPLRDFIFNPAYANLEECDDEFYCGRRYITTLETLKSYQVVDPETGEMIPKYTNLDQINNQATSNEEKTDKEQKDMFYGSTIDGSDGDDNQVEVIEIWTGTRTVSVANRKVCIEDVENPHYTQAKQTNENATKGIIPFAAQRNYIDESLFYGKGEPETFAEQQELLNDLTNQNTDAITYNLNQMYTLDPDAADMIEEIENIPGAVYPLKDGQLKPIPMQAIPANAFNERMNIKNEIRETTASDQILKGVAGTGHGDQTATEVQAQVAGAAQRFGLKITQLENEGFHRLARIIFEMVRLYVTKPQMVRVVGKDGVNWEEFNPEEFTDGEYEPRVQLANTVQANKQADIAKYKELMGAMIGDPMINKQELYKLVLPKVFDLDPDEIGSLLQPDEQMMAMLSPQPQAPAPEQPKINISLKGDLTPPQVDAAAQMGGVQTPEGAPTAMDYASAQTMGITPDLALHHDQNGTLPTELNGESLAEEPVGVNQ